MINWRFTQSFIFMLLDIIEKDFKQALRQKQTKVLEVLRGLKTSLHNKEIELRGSKKELDEEIIIGVLRQEIKKRREAVELYKQGNRLDLAGKEQEEAEILSRYLPDEMPDEKIREIVLKIIKETQAQGQKDFGRVMGKVMTQVKGSADGNKVKRIVEEEICKL